MDIAIIILSVIIILLLTNAIYQKRQLDDMKKQIDDRLETGSRQLVTVSTDSKKIKELAIAINECLKTEENLRLKSIDNENEFKTMIAGISHDLRTPLTAIKGYTQLLNTTKLTDKQRNEIQIISKHSDELGNLIEQFFEYTCALSNEQPPKLYEIDLNGLLIDVIVEQIPSYEEKNMSIVYKEIPKTYIFTDANMLRRILNNILRNACQHGKEDEKVEILYSKVEDDLTLTIKNKIKDNDEVNINKLFDIFYVSDSSRRNSTGLGLAVVKLLCEKLGYKIEAKNENGTIEMILHILL